MNWAELMLEKSSQSGGSATSRGKTVSGDGRERDAPPHRYRSSDGGVGLRELSCHCRTTLAIELPSWMYIMINLGNLTFLFDMFWLLLK